MQLQEFTNQFIVFQLTYQWTLQCFGRPVFCFQKRATAVITKDPPVFIKVTSISFGNIGWNRIGCFYKLHSHCSFSKVFPFCNYLPYIFPYLLRQYINFEVFQLYCIHTDQNITKYPNIKYLPAFLSTWAFAFIQTNWWNGMVNVPW